jgi:hypothetical protein
MIIDVNIGLKYQKHPVSAKNTVSGRSLSYFNNQTLSTSSYEEI